MTGILYDATKVKVYELLAASCSRAGESDEWRDSFWLEVLQDGEVYEELVFYLRHHELRERLRAYGYTLIDLFIWEMGQANLRMDTGKNTGLCNKESMALRAYRAMLELKRDPERFLRRLREGRGMDQTT